MKKANFSQSLAVFANDTQTDRTFLSQKKGELLVHLLNKAGLLQALLSNLGVHVSLTSDAAFAQIRRMNDFDFAQIVRKFEVFLDDIMINSNDKSSYRDTIQSLWHIYAKYGWKMNQDLISQLEGDDVVEIYLEDGTQAFRNLEYFKKTSYSIVDLLVFPWTDLIEHDLEILNSLLEINQEIFSLKKSQMENEKKYQIRPYFATERFSPMKYTAHLKSKFIAPIYGKVSENAEAALVVWRIDLLDSSEISSLDHKLMDRNN